MSSSRTGADGKDPGGNPGKAGPKGALGLPAARGTKRGRRPEDKNEQRNFVTLSKTERRKSRRDGDN